MWQNYDFTNKTVDITTFNKYMRQKVNIKKEQTPKRLPNYTSKRLGEPTTSRNEYTISIYELLIFSCCYVFGISHRK